jgi:type II secretory pathway component PulC
MPPEETFAAVVQRPVFSPARRRASAPGAGDLSTTSADFSLVGVIMSDGERFVLVKPHNTDKLERLHEGDTLAGWSAVSIAPDRVLFRRGTAEEEILLNYAAPAPFIPRPEPKSAPTNPQPASEGQTAQPGGAPQDEAGGGPPTTNEAPAK